MNKSKKIISIVAAAMLALSTGALAGCNETEYKGDDLQGYVSNAQVSSQGGFVVEKGDYVYFINGVENNTASNKYGKVVKGALMRIGKAELAAGNYDEAKMVVPSLFVTGNYDSGIYIYGDYVYYATPTTDKDNDGNVANSSLDFKRAKIDGNAAPMDGKDSYLLRLTSNTTKYRFVQPKADGPVYLLYEEDSKLKSYNVETKETTVLVAGASAFYYDTSDLASGDVYYTMPVSYGLDTENPTSVNYNQIYRVNAANTAVVDEEEGKYTVYNGSTELASYKFDAAFLKDDPKDAGYELDDYTTYPYVNLGQLVLDGVSKFKGNSSSDDNRFNKDDIANAKEYGYTYTLQKQENDGLYFTRKKVVGVPGSESVVTELPELLYLANDSVNASGWNTITGNEKGADKTVVVSDDTSKASATALYTVESGVHTFYYISGTDVVKATGADEMILVEEVASDSTLWKVEGNYLYYYGTGTNGKNLTRIDCKTGTKEDYLENYQDKDEYNPQTISMVDWYDSWYKPEFVNVGGGKQFLFYPNAQSYGAGATSYNYVYAADLTPATVKAWNENVEKVTDAIDEYSQNSEAQAVMKYFFQTGETEAYEAVKTEYKEATQQKYISEFIAKFEGADGFKHVNSYLHAVGRMTDDDKEAMAQGWVDSLKKTADETDDDNEGLPTWAIVLIVVGSVLVVGAAVVIPTVIAQNKKKAKKAKEESIVTAYKRKSIDTTDDKSIDVYADEEEAPAQPVEEAPAESAEEVVEEAPVAEETAPEEAFEQSAPVEEVSAEEEAQKE